MLLSKNDTSLCSKVQFVKRGIFSFDMKDIMQSKNILQGLGSLE